MPGLLDYLLNARHEQPQQMGLPAAPQALPDMGLAEPQEAPAPSLLSTPATTDRSNTDPWPDRLAALSQYLIDFGAGLNRASTGGYRGLGGIGFGLQQANRAAANRQRTKMLAALLHGDFGQHYDAMEPPTTISEPLRRGIAPQYPAHLDGVSRPPGPQDLARALQEPTDGSDVRGMGRFFSEPPQSVPARPSGPLLHTLWRFGGQ